MLIWKRYEGIITDPDLSITSALRKAKERANELQNKYSSDNIGWFVALTHPYKQYVAIVVSDALKREYDVPDVIEILNMNKIKSNINLELEKIKDLKSNNSQFDDSKLNELSDKLLSLELKLLKDSKSMNKNAEKIEELEINLDQVKEDLDKVFDIGLKTTRLAKKIESTSNMLNKINQDINNIIDKINTLELKIESLTADNNNPLKFNISNENLNEIVEIINASKSNIILELDEDIRINSEISINNENISIDLITNQYSIDVVNKLTISGLKINIIDNCIKLVLVF